MTLTTEGCLKQAAEYIQLAEACSDPDLKKQYLKIAGELTVLATALDKDPNSENPALDAQATIAPE